MASSAVLGLAGFFSFSAIFMALWHIVMHLFNYTEPTFQRYTVRIVFMVPIFALMSFLCILYQEYAVYFDSVCQIYEAFVIYNFLSLCLAWVGGPGSVVQSLQGRMLKPSWHLMTCCMDPIPLDGVFIRRCKQGGIQFVIIKPLLVAATFILYSLDLYDDGNFSVTSGYLYITLIYTVSYSVALYVLVLFYVACADLLRPYKALPKFIIIKSVVFLTYWQGVGVYIVAKMGYIKTADEAEIVQNFLVCFEMLIAAMGHVYAFPYKQYAEANVGGSGNLSFWASLSHALSLNDVVHDTLHQFAPTYHDYVLYSDGSQEAPMRYRARTFVPTGQEMDTLRRHSKMFGAGTIDPASASTLGLGGASFGSAAFSRASFISQGGSLSGEAGRRKTQARPSPQSSLSGFGNFPNDPQQPQQQPHSFEAALFKAALPPLPNRQPSMGSILHIRSPVESRNSSLIDSRRSGRRSSAGDDAMETSLLAPGRRKSSHGALLDEIDIHGEEDQYDEGYIQR
ncbi:transmembrane protein 184B [Selaginella moellendorffii]|nr:transmembrane protein 184B [Selaginella moellendorffii]|eukprot:XP_002992534.2 transmembrane protein 184B [Selaginella moellendorffii]